MSDRDVVQVHRVYSYFEVHKDLTEEGEINESGIPGDNIPSTGSGHCTGDQLYKWKRPS